MPELLLSPFGGGRREDVCVCVWLCGCSRINACTCAWRARRRQQSPERTLYLERASHDLAWSRPSFLGWGLCTPMCVCVWMLSAGDLQIFEMAVPLRIGLRFHQWLTVLIWLTAWSSFQPTKQPTGKVQIPDCWGIWSAMRWQRRSYSPLCVPKQNAQPPVSLSLSTTFSVCLFVSTTLLDLHILGLSWIWQFDRLSQF